MKSALKTIALAAAIGLSAISGAAAEQVRVGIAAEPYPPFASPDASGNWQGWEVDFMKAICAEAKLDCVITTLTFDGLIPALTSNKIDMIIASMSITAARQQAIDFSDKYYKTLPAIIGPKDVKFQPTPEGLAGKTLGVQSGSIHQAYAERYFTPAGATLKEYQTQDEATNDLAAGRIDAFQADSIALSEYVKTEQGACCEVKGTVKDDPEILGPGIGVGLRKGETELKEKVNTAINAIRANGTYDTFSKKYFDFDLYGE